MASHNVAKAATTEPRREKQRQEELAKIASYQSLVEAIELKITECQYTAEVLRLTTQLLKENPEYYTIWNVRRRLLIYGLFSNSSDSSLPSSQSLSTTPIATTKTSAENYSSSTSTSSVGSTTTQVDQSHQSRGKNGTILELIQEDLNFLVPLLRQWPKCYWIWNHRMWLLHEATRRLDVSSARRLWQEDMGLVGMMLVKDSRNFHGWSYRRTLVAELESPLLNGTSMVESEFEYTTKMIKANLSNFSAWHNRSKLIPRLLNEREAGDSARKAFLDNELEMMKNALWVANPDQSVWFYYQFLMTALIDRSAWTTIVPNFSRADRASYVEQQLLELKDMLDGADEAKWIYNALIDYTSALWQLREGQIPPDVKQDLRDWLAELRNIDPTRTGRWIDLEKILCLQ